MTKDMPTSRKSWTDALLRPGEASLSASERQQMAAIDAEFYRIWMLGANVLLGWTRSNGDALVVAAPNHAIADALHLPASSEKREAFTRYVSADMDLPPEEFARLAQLLANTEVHRVALGAGLGSELVSRVLGRYRIKRLAARAVVLLDIVGFSLFSPLVQVALLNSLSHALNASCAELLARNEAINFARTTTGDGFYVWNRESGLLADAALFKLLALVLARNESARLANDRAAPQLRAAFHVGECYEFYQVEGLNPTSFGFVVGDVTIGLARLIHGAVPQQIVLGEFGDAAQPGGGTVEFMARIGVALRDLRGIFSGLGVIDRVASYITGPQTDGRDYSAARYTVIDKHGVQHHVYNMKINIHHEKAAPIFLGIQHAIVHRHGANEFPWPIL
jgi:hypothetical protein